MCFRLLLNVFKRKWSIIWAAWKVSIMCLFAYRHYMLVWDRSCIMLFGIFCFYLYDMVGLWQQYTNLACGASIESNKLMKICGYKLGLPRCLFVMLSACSGERIGALLFSIHSNKCHISEVESLRCQHCQRCYTWVPSYFTSWLRIVRQKACWRS